MNSKDPFLGIALVLIIAIAIWSFIDIPVVSPSPSTEDIPTNLEVNDAHESFLLTTEFTEKELLYIEALQNKGVLKMATRELDFSYLKHDDGSITGFNYLFAKAFSESLEVDLDVKLVGWDTFFEIDGVVPENVQSDDSVVYTPDILNEVDLLCNYMTILPWREKLFFMVPIFPVKQMLIKRNDVEVNTIDDLKGKTISIFRNTSYHLRLNEIEKELDTTFEYHFVEDEIDQNIMVSDGFAEVSVMDSIIAIRDITRYNNLEMGFPITDVQVYGWVVNFDNPELKSVLEKYVDYAKKTGKFDAIWYDEYDITHLEYLNIIDYNY